MTSDLVVCREDLVYWRGSFEKAERADLEGRVTNVSEWVAAQARRRWRIAELVEREAELVALEESGDAA